MRLIVLTGLTLTLAGCSAENGMFRDAAAESGGWGDTAYAPEDGDGYTDGAGESEDTYAPETESDYLKLAPAATTAYVFVANPDRNTVTRVSVPSLEVITAEVGVDPEAVATTSDYTMAVTFNAGSDSVSIVQATSLEVTEVEVRPNLNTMEMSPDGAWVVLYRDLDGEDYDAGSGGVTAFNEVSLVNLATGTHYLKIVGFNPRDVQFTADGRLAVVVSDAYLGVIDLTDPDANPERVPLTEDTVDPPEAEEVLLTPDSDYAIVRQFGVEDLVLVDLASFSSAVLDVGDNPTDLDLTPDGEHAVAVARGANQVWIYHLEDILSTPTVLNLPDGEVLGSVTMSPDNTKALLYSTASGVSHVTAWDLEADEFQVYGLEKPISSVTITPDGGTAIFFHDKDNGADVDPGSIFYNEYAMTLMDLSDFFPSALLLPAEPTGFADDEEGDIGYFIMDGVPYLEVLDFDNLSYEEVELKSAPVHVGVLPESRLAYVNQEHDLGRLSFYDPDAGELQTLTGFELNAAIEHEE